MAAYITVNVTPKNSEKLQQYSASVPEILTKYEGEVLCKGPVERLHGDFSHKMQVIIKFPSRKNALQWYHSEEYQALIPGRDSAMDSEFQLVG